MLHQTLRLTILLSVLSAVGQAGVVYNESASGDLSNSGLSPTSVAFGSGSNMVFGSTGNPGTGTDRDYFTFTIPTGMVLASVTELPGTTAGGLSAFFGIEAGNQVTLPTNTQNAIGLLGWWHYNLDDLNKDILGPASIPATGSSGFTTPLPAGSYAVWIQDFTGGNFAYGFDFQVNTVPEPATWSAAFLGAAILIARRRMAGR